MNTSFLRLPWLLGATLALTAFVLAGCNQGPKLVPVEGKVTLDGQPLQYGHIRVIPASGRTAYSDLDEQGRFKLMTDLEEGCPVGTHTVTVGSVKSLTETQQRRYAPEKYESGITTDLTIDVKEPQKDLVIELKGDGKRYPYDYRG